MADQWDQFPDAPADLQSDDWSIFPDAPSHVRKASRDGTAKIGKPTGEVHDGDTFKMEGGANARLSGVDAFELDQQGRTRAGLVPIGRASRDYLKSNISPDSSVKGVGAATYGRPVVTLDNSGADVGRDLIYSGNALAAPEYLRGDPRLPEYMETERLARLNRRGAFAGEFASPTDHRRGKLDPWAEAETTNYGNSIAVFPDEATPFQGLRPEIEKGYIDLAKDRSSTAGDLVNYAQVNGFDIDPKVAERFVRERNAGRPTADKAIYEAVPKVLTDPGDGIVGAGLRGLADPVNMLDEVGGIVDTLGGTGGRENLWNSDRRFGDILWNNIDQNRSVLDYDDANHPYARFGGQLASGLVLPGASIDGVGLAAARAALREGGSRFAAEAAAKAAVRSRLGIAGAVEGGLAGAGAGEGGPLDRLPGAALGTATGFALGYGSGALGQALGPVGRSAINHIRGRRVAETGMDQTPVADVDQALQMRGAADDIAPEAARMGRGIDDAATPVALPRGDITADGWDQFPDAPAHIAGMANEAVDEGVGMVGRPPRTGLVPANIGDDGKVYIGDPGTSHFSVTEKYPDVRFGGATGFVNPEGRYLSREDALAWVNANGENIRPSENMAGQLDALDYREQARVRPTAMANETDAQPSMASPRVVDKIDVNDRARPMNADATEAQRFAQGQRIEPGDVLPIPSNEVASIDEAANIAKGMYAPVKPMNEADELRPRAIPSPVDGTRTLPKRGPLDLMTYLRTKGGLVDHGGELRSMGIDNAGRDLDFAKGEQRFGKLVDPDRGMTLDDAALDAWEAGYFPDHVERPTINEFLNALDDTNRGMNRAFRPEDMAEVDAFNAARDQRFAVEKARDEGAPMVTDRSQPATLADLEANQPPVSAYEEWGSNAPDFAGNIRLGKLESPQDIKRALAVTDQRVGGFDAATRGRITQKETEALASELGMTADDLLRRRKGEAMNAEQALAARQILAKSGNELVNMARAIKRLDDPGEEKLAAFRQAWVRHVAIQEQVAGATAEAGRTLAQFRMLADGRNIRGNVLNALSEGGGGKDRLKDAANLILEHVDNPREMNRAAKKALNPRWLDKINELWINSLLSGPATHVVNAVSNTMTALAQIPEHAIAAGIGGIRSVAQRKRIDDRVLFSELGARSVGLLQGTKEGLLQAARTLRTGEGSDFANKVEARTQDAISGIKGKIIRTPTRLLSSSDELFKAMARRMELNGLAVRQARAEGLSGEAGIKRAAELVANPTDEMLEKAFDYGRYVTFQRPLSAGMAGISRGIQNTPFLKFIVPFVRTPTNLLKFSLERSPAAIFMDTWKADFRAGGARRDLAVARAMVGTGVGALVAELASKGMITGSGPADQDAKQLMRADGWQPYSVKIGDKYYSYSRMDPFATTLGVAAGMVDLQQHMTEKQKGDVATLVTVSIMQNLSNKTWLSGIGDMVRAMDDPDRYGSSWTERLAGSAAIPTGVAQIARTIDPTLRDADGILDSIRARVPGLSSSLPPRRDVWGQPIVGEGGAGPDLISPAYVSTAKNDPVNKALLDAEVHVSKPQKKWQGRPLTPKEYGAFHELSGSFGKQAVGGLISSPEWGGMTQDDRQEAVSKAMRDARKVAGGILFSGDAGQAVPAAGNDPWAEFPDVPERGQRPD